MKLSKKLIPAIGMLMLSAVMLVTSSFAWFSMNTTVTATGMTVTAKGDQVYLEIINSTQTFAANPGLTSVAAPDASKLKENLQPVAPANAIVDGALSYTGVGNTIKWYSNHSNAIDSHVGVNGYDDVSANDTIYLKNTFKIRLNPNTGATTANGLKVSGVKFADGTKITKEFAKCVSVLVVCGENSQLWKQSTTKGTFEQATGSTVYLSADNSNKFTNIADGVSVDIYLFFNGEDATCTIAKLQEAIDATENNYQVEVSFTVQ